MDPRSRPGKSSYGRQQTTLGRSSITTTTAGLVRQAATSGTRGDTGAITTAPCSEAILAQGRRTSRAAGRFMSTRPNATLADFSRARDSQITFSVTHGWSAFWRGRPWFAERRIGETSLAVGSSRFWIGWVTRHGDKCARSTCRDWIGPGDRKSIQPMAKRLALGAWREFEIARPKALGALLDAAVHGLRAMGRLHLDRLPHGRFRALGY